MMIRSETEGVAAGGASKRNASSIRLTRADKPDRRIHERLLQGDPTASKSLFETYLAPLIQWLHGQFRTLENDSEVDSVVIDAIMNLIMNPERFKPEKGSLWNYLHLAAKRDLLDKIRSRQKHPIISLDEGWEEGVSRGVANELADPNASIEDQVQAKLSPNGLPDGVCLDEVMHAVEAAFKTPLEKELLTLILDEVRDYEPYAEAMNLLHLPEAAQRKEVLKVKNTLKRRLTRIGEKLQPRVAVERETPAPEPYSRNRSSRSKVSVESELGAEGARSIRPERADR